MSHAATLMKTIDSVLTLAVGRHQKKHGGELPPGACLHEKVDNYTPADALADKEAAQGIREPGTMPLFAGMNGAHATPFEELAAFERDAEAESREAVLMKLEAFFWVLDFCFAEGPHPGKVMRRLYALVKKYRPELIWDMGYRDLGSLFGETGAAMEFRIGAILDDYAKAHGLTNVKMPWQRTAEACGNYSTSQKDNANRTGGKRSAKQKAKAKKK